MRKYQILISLLVIFGILFLTGGDLLAQKHVWVKGYYKSNGTYVQGHYRTAPDGNPKNNFSYPGNYNPYTGKTATGNPETYLRNYYNKSKSKSNTAPYGLVKNFNTGYESNSNSETTNPLTNYYNPDSYTDINSANDYNYLLPALNSANSLLPALNLNNSSLNPLYEDSYLLPALYDE